MCGYKLRQFFVRFVSSLLRLCLVLNSHAFFETSFFNYLVYSVCSGTFSCLDSGLEKRNRFFGEKKRKNFVAGAWCGWEILKWMRVEIRFKICCRIDITNDHWTWLTLTLKSKTISTWRWTRSIDLQTWIPVIILVTKRDTKNRLVYAFFVFSLFWRSREN